MVEGPCGGVGWDGQDVGAPPISSLPETILGSIFEALQPRQLVAVSLTCSSWRAWSSSAYANRLWRNHYQARWELRQGLDMQLMDDNWAGRYNSRELALQNYRGKYMTDHCWGHKGSVRCCRLLPSHNLMATGSVDKSVRVWDLEARMLSVSRPHGGTVRSLAMDDRVLVSGSSDSGMRLWLACPGASAHHGNSAAAGSGDGEGKPRPLFDVSLAPDMVLQGHTGPVAAMCISQAALYTGSWDYTVRVWSRDSWECVQVLGYDDWVSGVVARGGNLVVAAGRDVCVHDLGTGQMVRKFQGLHEGHAACIEADMAGRMLYTGAADGLVLGHDLRMKEASCVMWHHSGGVHALSFEDPWLASAASDGTVVLMNTEAQAAARAGASSAATASHAPSHRALSANCRALQTQSGTAYALDMCEQWIACGGDAAVVNLYDFRGAALHAARAVAGKAERQAAREARRKKAAAQLAVRQASASHASHAANQQAPLHMHHHHAQPRNGRANRGQQPAQGEGSSYAAAASSAGAGGAAVPASTQAQQQQQQCPNPNYYNPSYGHAGGHGSGARRKKHQPHVPRVPGPPTVHAGSSQHGAATSLVALPPPGMHAAGGQRGAFSRTSRNGL